MSRFLFTYLFIFLSFPFSQTSVEELIKQADELSRKKDYKAAIEALESAYQKDKGKVLDDDSFYFEILGYNYLMVNQLNKSNSYLLKAIKLDPTTVYPYYNLACIHFRKEELEQGLKYLEISFQNGYENYNWLDEDEDLEIVRNTDKYKKIYNKYFSKKDIELIKIYNKARDYYEKKNYKKAAKNYKKAAKLEDKTSFVRKWKKANAYFYIAGSYTYLKKWKTSIKYYKKYYDLEEPRSNLDQADRYSSLGTLYYLAKKNKEALEFGENALSLYLELNDSLKIGEVANDIASLYEFRLDNIDKAVQYYEIAFNHGYKKNIFDENIGEEYLTILFYYFEKMNMDQIIFWSDKAHQHSNQNSNDILYGFLFNTLLGATLSKIDPRIGMNYILESLSIADENNFTIIDDDGGISLLGLYFFAINNYISFGDGSNAEKYIKRATEFITLNSTKGLYEPLVSYLMGLKFYYYNDYTNAERKFSNVIKVTRPSEEWFSLVPLSYSNIAAIKIAESKYEEAEAISQKIIDLARNSQNSTSIEFQGYFCLLIIAMYTSNYELEKDALEKIINLTENQLPKETTIYLSDAFDSSLMYYEWLALSLLRDNEIDKALNIIDQSKNKSLKNNLGYDPSKIKKPKLRNNEALLMLEEINSKDHVVFNMATAFPNQKGFEIDEEWGENLDQLFIHVSTNDSAYWNILYKNDMITDNDFSDLKVVSKLYLDQLKSSHSNISFIENSKVLNKILIENNADQFNVDKLIISPDPILSNLPIETLIDKDGKYLVEKYDISYIQSPTVLGLLQERDYSNNYNNILAIGGIEYSINNFSQIPNKELDYIINVKSRRNIQSPNDILGSLGYNDWNYLSGTLDEIYSIKEKFINTDIISGTNASETTIKSLSINNKIKNYNIIHFATHGIVVPELPHLSSLVLSSVEDNANDGYLTLDEVSKLNLKADFVNLSACETGLGKVFAGDGVIGLTQAFMEAGANGVCVSLWPVEDQSTAIFMTSVYAKIADGFTYSFAITDTKRDFISGKYGEEYKKPYYWAPFVYYGK